MVLKQVPGQLSALAATSRPGCPGSSGRVVAATLPRGEPLSQLLWTLATQSAWDARSDVPARSAKLASGVTRRLRVAANTPAKHGSGISVDLPRATRGVYDAAFGILGLSTYVVAGSGRRLGSSTTGSGATPGCSAGTKQIDAAVLRDA